jgi:hypothetical protein
MRQIYTTPRPENIDRVVALLDEHGIETTVNNRSNWNRPSYERFSYAQPEQNNGRESWPQVWVNKAEDYTRARALLKEIGIEPAIRHAEELAAARDPSPVLRRRGTATRVRRIVLVAVLAAFALVMLRYLHMI